MKTEIYKWENGKIIKVNSIKDAAITPPHPQHISKKYKEERDRAARGKNENT
jgi:hypothetical protein